MKKHHQVASLAAAIALAMGSTAAMAATPTATQLPGKGKVVTVGTVDTATGVTVDATNGAMDVTVTGNTVINWGAGTDINKDGVGGFNVGSKATVTFTGGSVLNIDSSGNASQIMGAVSGDANVFVANTNGIIVGKGGSIQAVGAVGLIANTIAADQTGFAGTAPDYNGTGGDVTVAAGSHVGDTSATSVLITGGNVVNVDVSAIGSPVTISAGLPGNGGAFATENDGAQVNLSASVSGMLGASDVVQSAGDGSSSGEIDLSAMTTPVDVAGTFTNTGTLFVGTTTFNGALDNENTITGMGILTAASLVNNGELNVLSGVTTTDGGITNNAKLVTGNIIAAGDFANTGTVDANGNITTGALSNDGTISMTCCGITTTGDFLNNGSIANAGEGGPGSITATDGSITNAGELEGFTSLSTISTEDFEAAADYSITNSGSIVSTGGFSAYVNNSTVRFGDDANDTTGSFTNTGTLSFGGAVGVTVLANNDVALGGSLTAGDKALSETNALGSAFIGADNGVLTIDTPLITNGFAYLHGAQARIMADVVDVSASGEVDVNGGHLDGADYDIRIAAGKTVSATSVYVDSYDGTTNPSVILQGTVAGNSVYMGSGFDGDDVYALGDVFTGPNGSIQATGEDPFVEFNFTGRVKNAPYLNSSNFRYNFLPITVTDDASVSLVLNPVDYETNGTDNGLSAVNILVNGGVNLDQEFASGTIAPGGTAVSGLNDLPNTHLVLQSTGNIDVNTGYWPGYVYLGTIGSDADGNALPGTLGLGELTFDGNFSNVLPGNVDGASGMHFMTQFPVDFGGGSVITNANAWVNFATDMLTEKYTTENDAEAFLFGGTKSATSNVVTYGALDADSINTHPVDASK